MGITPPTEKAWLALGNQAGGLLATTGGLMAPADTITEAWTDLLTAIDALGDQSEPLRGYTRDPWVRGNVEWAQANPGHPGRRVGA